MSDTVCPCCGQPLPPEDVDALVARMLSAANARGLLVSGDLRVSEKDAADLVGISRAYLVELRLEGRGPNWVRLGCGGGSRISYSILELAKFVAARSDNPG